MKARRSLLYLILVAIVAGSILPVAALNTIWKGWRLVNEPLHSAMEALGMLAGIMMVGFLLGRRKEENGEKLFLIAMGFAGMVLLDSPHAVSRLGHGFVILDGVASLVGGFCFFLVWLPRGALVRCRRSLLQSSLAWEELIPSVVAAVSIFFAVWTLLARKTLPVMIENKEFTTAAVTIELLAGVFFVLAAGRLMLDFHRSGKLEIYLFTCVALLFGLAGLTFQYSSIWGSVWWLWHILRLIAYLLVLWYMFHEYRRTVFSLKVQIDEGKRMEKELRLHSEHLEELVRKRTRDLRDAERLAAIGELAAMVGHDLRNPLTGIAIAAEYLRTKMDSKWDEKARKMLQIIGTDVDYSNRILNDLLGYSREIKLELAETNPQSIMRDALTLVKVPTNVYVSDFSEDKPRIKVDVEKMKRCLVNIIENAIEAMPKGGKLTITNRESNGNVEITLTDTGTGIPQEIIEKVWKPLFTTKAKGVGLGLPICKRIVQAHGGSISVESTVGKGSTFIIRLPVMAVPKVGTER